MSMQRDVTVKCPKCNSLFETTICDSISTKICPDATDKIISGKFFEALCPSCNNVCMLEYKFTYDDFMHNIVVCVIDENNKADVDAINKAHKFTSALGMMTRIVRNTRELREKVAIFKNERNDCAIEILKTLLYSQVLKEFPNARLSDARYVCEGGTEYFVYFDNSGVAATLTFDEESYQKIMQQFSVMFNNGKVNPCEIIDYSWALKILEQYHSRTENEASICEITAEQAMDSKTKNTNEEIHSGDFHTPIHCNKCGEINAEGSLYCRICGHKLKNKELRKQKPFKERIKNLADKIKRSPKWLKKGVLLLLVLLVVCACNIDSILGHIYGVDIYRNVINLEIGESHKIGYETSPDSIRYDVLWKSSDPSVVSVTSGNIKAKKEGSAKITVSINGVEKDTCIVNVSLKSVSVRNGEIIVRPRKTGYPEVTVRAPKGENCYVYLENISNKSNSCGFYVKAGSKATVNVAAGTYALYYATGETWYGSKYKFGKGTSFFKSPNTTKLTESSYNYDTVEFTLYAVHNGNMHTKAIDESEFPG